MRWLVWLISITAVVTGQDAARDLARRAVEEHKRGDLPAAVRDYQALLKVRPELTKIRANLAGALTDLGRIDEAVAELEAVPPAEKNNPVIRRGLALAYYRQQNLPRAISELESLRQADPGDVAAITMLADCYTRSGKPGNAVALLTAALQTHPADTGLKYQLGSALTRTGQPEKALEPLEDAGRSAKSADALLLAGATALGVGQFERARNDLEQAARLNPSIPGVWTWTGMARDRVSDEDGAKEAFRRALGADPNDFEAVFHLGAILYRERDLKSARPYLERAVALQPSSPPARYALALVRAAAGETNQAIQDLEAIISAAPNWPEPHVKLAALYFRSKRRTDGEREQRVVEALREEHKEQRISMPALEPER